MCKINEIIKKEILDRSIISKDDILIDYIQNALIEAIMYGYDLGQKSKNENAQ